MLQHLSDPNNLELFVPVLSIGHKSVLNLNQNKDEKKTTI